MPGRVNQSNALVVEGWRRNRGSHSIRRIV